MRYSGMLWQQVQRNRRNLEQIVRLTKDHESRIDRHAFAHDPVEYAHKVLKIAFIWERQAEIMRAILKPPYKVMVKSGHNVGMSFLAAVLTNWWYDSFDPSVVITTAPTKRDVEDILWKEVRIQRQRAGLGDDFIGPSAPEMKSSPGHYAKGFTASKNESFHGRHDERMFFVFDEAAGVSNNYWESARGMFKPEPGHGWLAIFNPTDPSCPAYREEEFGDWNVFTLNSMDHPNITAATSGTTWNEEAQRWYQEEGAAQPSLIPAAVSRPQIDTWVKDWCIPVKPEELLTSDFEWHVDGLPEIRFWRPAGAEFNPRCRGLWPDASMYGIWSDSVWSAIEGVDLGYEETELPQIGCDVARYGDDKTAIHVRRGSTSLRHESYSGWSTVKTTERLERLARILVAEVNQERDSGPRPRIEIKDIVVRIDDDGVGGGVVDQCQANGLNAIGVGAGTRATDEKRYRNKRSELWFLAAACAAEGFVSFGRLDPDVRKKIKAQAMAPVWRLDGAGRREVEPKEDTKKPNRLGRSPDDMDAVNLAYYEHVGLGEMMVVEPDKDLAAAYEHSEHMGGWTR